MNDFQQAMDEETKAILDFDPLAEVEALGLPPEAGIGLHMMKVQEKNAILKMQDDTHYGIQFDEFLRIAKDEGFNIEHEFGSHPDDTEYGRRLFLWHPDGIALIADEWRGNVNTAEIFYNWRADDPDSAFKFMSSGHLLEARQQPTATTRTVIGFHDVRDAFRLTLRRLRSNGEFLNPWLETVRLHILRSPDYRRGEKEDGTRIRYESVDRLYHEMVSQLPQHLKDAMLID